MTANAPIPPLVPVPPVPTEPQHGATRVSRNRRGPVKPPIHPNARRALSRRSSLRAQVPPPVWAEACARYVSGELTTYQAVADCYGINHANVFTRAKREKWQELRSARMEKLKALAGEGLVHSLLPNASQVADLASVQSGLAQSVLAHGSALAATLPDLMMDLAKVRAKLVGAMPETDTSHLAARLSALVGAMTETVDTVRVLAGIPHPDKAKPKAQTEAEPAKRQSAPDSEATDFGPVGAPQETGRGEGGGFEGQTVPPVAPPPPEPTPAPTHVWDPHSRSTKSSSGHGLDLDGSRSTNYPGPDSDPGDTRVASGPDTGPDADVSRLEDLGSGSDDTRVAAPHSLPSVADGL